MILVMKSALNGFKVVAHLVVICLLTHAQHTKGSLAITIIVKTRKERVEKESQFTINEQ